jgi:hypothetical protein
MKFAIIAASLLIMFSTTVLAQNASTTGSTTTTGDAAVSPATPNSSNALPIGASRSTPGAGVNSGVLDNGTTGDTIGTGPGTSNQPATNPARK